MYVVVGRYIGISGIGMRLLQHYPATVINSFPKRITKMVIRFKFDFNAVDQLYSAIYISSGNKTTVRTAAAAIAFNT